MSIESVPNNYVSTNGISIKLTPINLILILLFRLDLLSLGKVMEIGKQNGRTALLFFFVKNFLNVTVSSHCRKKYFLNMESRVFIFPW